MPVPSTARRLMIGRAGTIIKHLAGLERSGSRPSPAWSAGCSTQALASSSAAAIRRPNSGQCPSGARNVANRRLHSKSHRPSAAP